MPLPTRLIVGVVLAGALIWGWHRLPRSAFYGAGGPTRLGRATNRFWTWWAGAGLPPARQVALELRGRKSGQTRSCPVVIVTVGGKRYLVSMLGERAGWVANARSGGPASLRHGRREAVRLVEVFGPERVTVLREYLRRAPGARAHFPVRPDSPDSELATVVDKHPMFRVVAQRQPGR